MRESRRNDFQPRGRFLLILVGLFLLLLLVVLVAAGTGAVAIPPAQVLAALVRRLPLFRDLPLPVPTPTQTAIIFTLRLPRILLALLAGAALAGSGTVLQGLFRNPLVDPYIIGISAGAGLGASLGFFLPAHGWGGIGVVPLFAFAGALATMLLVYGLARQDGCVQPLRLLLAGVAVSSLVSAVVSFLLFWRQQDTHAILAWLMGGLAGRGWPEVKMVWPYIIFGLVFLGFWARELNLLTLGEETAAHLGVGVEGLKHLLLFGAALTTAAAVAVSGTIGFVGLIIPHLVRLVAGPDHRRLYPLAVLVGAIFLLIADTLARTLLAPVELPVGIITALVGAPFFLYLLRRE